LSHNDSTHSSSHNSGITGSQTASTEDIPPETFGEGGQRGERSGRHRRRSRGRSRRGFWTFERASWVAIAIGICFLGAFGWHTFRPAPTIDDEHRCSENLKRIGLALNAYHKVHNAYPPAVVYNSEGRAMHSWRVLLLPYLGHASIYDMYNIVEPWNSETNQSLFIMMPEVFSCPSSKRKHGEGKTDYVALIGHNTLFDPQSTVKSADVRDEPDESLAIIELSGSSIQWTEPVDLEIDKTIRGPDDVIGGVGPCHSDRFNVLCVSGKTHSLPGSVDQKVFRALATIKGHEKISDPWASR